jgi:hypothetical protein
MAPPMEMAWVQFPRDISIATDLWQVGATLVVLLALISLLLPSTKKSYTKEYIILYYRSQKGFKKIHWKWCIG